MKAAIQIINVRIGMERFARLRLMIFALASRRLVAAA
jgi:hypothetical protein